MEIVRDCCDAGAPLHSTFSHLFLIRSPDAYGAPPPIWASPEWHSAEGLQKAVHSLTALRRLWNIEDRAAIPLEHLLPANKQHIRPVSYISSKRGEGSMDLVQPCQLANGAWLDPQLHLQTSPPPQACYMAWH